MLRVSIVGASGHVGGELIRLLIGHPEIEVARVTSRSKAGQPVRATHPHLRGRTDLRFTLAEDLEPCDLLFLALPHGEAATRIEEFASVAPRIIDCSADFRLSDAGAYEEWYKSAHPAPDWLAQFVYGLPEVNRELIRGANYVSGVGCNATASNLALLPLIRADLIDASRPVICDLKVGSSEGGRSAGIGSHHPERSGVVRSFAPVDHRHTAEVRAITGLTDVHLAVTSVELVRGAVATCHVWAGQDLDDKQLWRAYRACYGDEPFVRVVHERSGSYRHPEPRLLTGTNQVEVGWSLSEDRRRLVALCAIDNLVKGAAGSALQCLNLMCGFPESSGLEQFPIHPQ